MLNVEEIFMPRLINIYASIDWPALRFLHSPSPCYTICKERKSTLLIKRAGAQTSSNYTAQEITDTHTCNPDTGPFGNYTAVCCSYWISQPTQGNFQVKCPLATTMILVLAKGKSPQEVRVVESQVLVRIILIRLRVPPFHLSLKMKECKRPLTNWQSSWKNILSFIIKWNKGLLLLDVCNKLKAEDSAAAIRKHNEDSCTIYKLSSDELKHIFGYIGEGQYAFVACTYIDSLQWGEDFGCELKQMLGQHTIAAFENTMKIHAPSTNCQVMSSSTSLDILVKGSTLLLHALI